MGRVRERVTRPAPMVVVKDKKKKQKKSFLGKLYIE